MQAVTPVSSGIDHAYAELFALIKEQNSITYGELDALMLKDLRLFDVPKDEYFKQIEDSLDRIIRVLPAIKRIFAKPIVRLKDVSEVVPAEMARIINSHTLSHASNHSELWDDITEDGIKPKKLMTVGRAETYAIYENIVFARVVDAVLRFLRRTEALLKDVLYNCREMQFNLLDRTHHASFFLALGKLYSGYSKAQEMQYASYFRCAEKIVFIDRVLRARLRLPVYAQCKKKSGKIALKKTSIFRVHKDYREVYRLARWIEGEMDPDALSIASEEEAPRGAYRAFCSVLAVFAAGHFNFTFAEKQTLDFSDLHAVGSFLDWRMELETSVAVSRETLIVRFQKERVHTVCLILAEKKDVSAVELEEIRGRIPADEYLFANAKEYGEDGVVYLSIFNIDSFRRLQQIYLRGMLLSDTARKTCPFCGNSLERQDERIVCGVCRAEMWDGVCPKTGEPYVMSGIKKYQRSAESARRQDEHGRFLHDRYLEASLHFRNITPLSQSGEPVCPRCGEVHE